jgi:hypothetical protein
MPIVVVETRIVIMYNRASTKSATFYIIEPRSHDDLSRVSTPPRIESTSY